MSREILWVPVTQVMTPNSPEGRQRRVTAWSRGGWGAARSKVEELGLGSALGPWAVVPGPLGAYPAPGPLAAHPAPGEEPTDFRVGRPGFESWHYAPLTCDMAGSCTSLSLGLFTGSVEVCVYIQLVSSKSETQTRSGSRGRAHNHTLCSLFQESVPAA